MASYIKKGKQWVARLRKRGYPEVYQGGFRTKSDAMDWGRRVEPTAFPSRITKGKGPHHTTLAEALNDYVRVVTCKQAGCVQALCKINKYLEAGGLPRLKAIKVEGGRVFKEDADGKPNAANQVIQEPKFDIVEESSEPIFEGKRQAGFAKRREANRLRGARPQVLRMQLAKMNVADVQSFHFEELVQLMGEDGYKSNTIRQEVAILSGFFSHAMLTWKWRLEENPALSFKWPAGTGRERVLSDDESMRLAAALSKCRNQKFRQFVPFAVETAMRKGEAINTVCWCDVDWTRSTLLLPHAKNGRREVPLTPAALAMLREMEQGAPTDQIFGLSDSQVQSSWRRVCIAAKLVDLHIHDLRHTAATFYATVLNGDSFLLEKVTGHSSQKMLKRYVNRTVDHAVRALATLSMPTLGQRMLMASEPSQAQQGVPGMADDAQGQQEKVISLPALQAQMAMSRLDGQSEPMAVGE